MGSPRTVAGTDSGGGADVSTQATRPTTMATKNDMSEIERGSNMRYRAVSKNMTWFGSLPNCLPKCVLLCAPFGPKFDSYPGS